MENKESSLLVLTWYHGEHDLAQQQNGMANRIWGNHVLEKEHALAKGNSSGGPTDLYIARWVGRRKSGAW